MKNILGLLLALTVASAAVFGLGRLIGASGPGLAMVALMVGGTVTIWYDRRFGTGQEDRRAIRSRMR